jgi:hypothetical protein
LQGRHGADEYGDDHNDAQGADANLRTLVHEFFPIHLAILRPGDHAPDHQEVTAYITKNRHSEFWAVKYDEMLKSLRSLSDHLQAGEILQWEEKRLEIYFNGLSIPC